MAKNGQMFGDGQDEGFEPPGVASARCAITKRMDVALAADRPATCREMETPKSDPLSDGRPTRPSPDDAHPSQTDATLACPGPARKPSAAGAPKHPLPLESTCHGCPKASRLNSARPEERAHGFHLPSMNGGGAMGGLSKTSPSPRGKPTIDRSKIAGARSAATAPKWIVAHVSIGASTRNPPAAWPPRPRAADRRLRSVADRLRK